ncbi:MAG TPA: AraC family transcriptional regulator [Thermoanaerobaculia bacterium]|nr:AraC family transcriptional regulator [Thermoanaerobaculia bacterium]
MPELRRIHSDAFSYYDRLQKVERYVEERCGEQLSLRVVARVAGLEAKYFSTWFHAKTGIRFKDWLTQVRITRALQLMARRDETITYIAFAVGFQDLRTFERACKRCTGMTPLACKMAIRPC